MKNTLPTRIQFTASRGDIHLIMQIAKRAVILATEEGGDYDLQTAAMDVEACHCNGCPLDLARLLGADRTDFLHDVFGIRHFIDRKTGALTDCFVPRTALKSS